MLCSTLLIMRLNWKIVDCVIVRMWNVQYNHTVSHSSKMTSQVTYLYSAFNNANCVKAALHQLDIKKGGFTSALQYLDGGNSVILLWPDNISSLNLG